jgi:hypothetical protein
MGRRMSTGMYVHWMHTVFLRRAEPFLKAFQGLPRICMHHYGTWRLRLATWGSKVRTTDSLRQQAALLRHVETVHQMGVSFHPDATITYLVAPCRVCLHDRNGPRTQRQP